jgi:hypothetical protein
MQRRPFLTLLLSTGTASWLHGCGSGTDSGLSQAANGGGSTATGTTRLKAQISLPDGAAIANRADLSVWNSMTTAMKPAADGSAEIAIFEVGAHYTEVRDSARRLVLAGFMSLDQASLSAQSTAELLAYVALGGALHPVDARPVVLASIQGLPGFASLVNLVSTQLTNSGYLTEDGALATALTDFARLQRGASANFNLRQTKGTKVEPNAYDSGISLDTLVDGELKITNNYLRRGKLWLERTGYKSEAGVDVSESVVLKVLDLPVPSRYGGFLGTATEIYQGNYLWTPVTMPTESIPLFPAGALETYYRLSVVGPGAIEGDLKKLPQERLNEQAVVALKAIVLDFVLPLVANILLPQWGRNRQCRWIPHCKRRFLRPYQHFAANHSRGIWKNK